MWDAFFLFHVFTSWLPIHDIISTHTHTQNEEESTPVVTKTPLKRCGFLRSGKSRIKWTAWNLQLGSFGVYHTILWCWELRHSSFLVSFNSASTGSHFGPCIVGSPAVPMHATSPPRVFSNSFSFSFQRTRQTLNTWRDADADVRLPECGSSMSMEPRARLLCPFLVNLEYRIFYNKKE